ncbi:hypothetical protein CEXT_366001 [Caerostris extrusa]|uniref:Uncharacterized protein n=1 Tax=Caerostris extrusa TaxID=172846 RepID=A0AAV4TIS1_CAEEX|nr:hypothetical protein CEXT_366001 [Caerostris extrusa]
MVATAHLANGVQLKKMVATTHLAKGVQKKKNCSYYSSREWCTIKKKMVATVHLANGVQNNPGFKEFMTYYSTTDSRGDYYIDLPYFSACNQLIIHRKTLEIHIVNYKSPYNLWTL